MECYYCKGKMIKSKAPFGTNRHGYYIAWESIPAWVCTQCGEALFEEASVNYIQKSLQHLDDATVELTLQPT